MQVASASFAVAEFVARSAVGVLCLLLVAVAGSAMGGPVTEERVVHADTRFRVVRALPEQVGLVWKDAKGQPYRSFDKVQSALLPQGKTVAFIMNAGLFQMGGTPCGLHIEDGKTLHAINLANGEGNFHLKPNGVLWIEAAGKDRRAFVAASEAFLTHQRELAGGSVVQTAVQSGPLLLIDGRRHPAFREGSPNRLHRNGVGVDAQGRVVFAITEAGQSVNFWDFAGLFLKLDCRNALFLDGNLSEMAVNPAPVAWSNQFGAMFVITR